MIVQLSREDLILAIQHYLSYRGNDGFNNFQVEDAELLFGKGEGQYGERIVDIDSVLIPEKK